MKIDEVGLRADEFVMAPWRPEQVSHLNRRQGRRRAEAYVCQRHNRTPLFATRYGWVCAVPVSRGEPCGYRQDWTRATDLTTW